MADNATGGSGAGANKNRPRLGKGLSSLMAMTDIPPATEAPAGGPSPAAPPAPARSPVEPAMAASATGQGAGAGRTVDLPVAAIQPNPHQPRRSWDQAKLAELASSIKASGIIQPVIVRQTNGVYQLIAGERRLRAAKLAGLAVIPAVLREVDELTQAQMALVENIQREDLNPIERAEGYRTLLGQLGLTQVELAGRLGEERSTVANFLRLLELAEPVKDLVRSGQLSLGHAKLLVGVADILEQERLAKLVVGQSLSVRNLERVLAAGPAPARREPAKASAHIADLEKTLSRQLGMRVQVRTGANKSRGRLVIHYSNLDQFDDLVGRLGLKVE